MLTLLLDEHISPEVASGARRKYPEMEIASLADWEGGKWMGADDESLLTEAARRRTTLVTYDRRTIPPLLKAWAEAGIRHGGVIFVDEKSIAPSDIGGLILALRQLRRAQRGSDWADAVCFLRR